MPSFVFLTYLDSRGCESFKSSIVARNKKEKSEFYVKSKQPDSVGVNLFFSRGSNYQEDLTSPAERRAIRCYSIPEPFRQLIFLNKFSSKKSAEYLEDGSDF